MPGIDCDVDCFPLVQITNHEGTTDADYAELFARLSGILGRGERFVCVVGATGFAFPSASQRRLIADWVPTVGVTMQKLSLGTALVLESAVQRGSVTALNWIMRPGVPMAAFETRPDALSWCRDRLIDAHLPIPARLDLLFRRERAEPA